MMNVSSATTSPLAATMATSSVRQAPAPKAPPTPPAPTPKPVDADGDSDGPKLNVYA